MRSKCVTTNWLGRGQDNILISHDGLPVLSDFGISRLLINSVTITGTTSIKGNTRWMAPELLLPEEGVELEHSCHTKATDVWAFGMVVYVRSEKLRLR